MKEIKAKWGNDIVDAYHRVLLNDEPCYTEFNGVYISNVPPKDQTKLWQQNKHR